LRSTTISRSTKFAAVLAAAALSLAACSSNGGEAGGSKAVGIPDGPIILGGTAPLSGTMSAYGKPQAAAYQAAVDYVNEKLAGIDGHQIKLEMKNDQSDPATGVALAQGFVQDKVAAIVFPSYSPIQEQELPIYQRAGMVLSTASAPSGEFNDVKKYPRIFSHYPDFDHLYTSTPAFLKASGITKVGIMVDALPTTNGLLDRLKSGFNEQGIQVVSVQKVPYGGTEFATPLRKMRDDGAEGVFALVSVGLAQVYDALRGLNWTPKVINATNGTPWFDGLDAVGDLAPIAYGDCVYGIEPGGTLDPKLKEILDYFAKKEGASFPAQIMGAIPALNSILTYKYAVEEAKSLDPAAVSKAIEGFNSKEYLTPANVVNFSKTMHDGMQKTETCSLQPLGDGQTPYIAKATADRQPIS
jgi:branched-chain amino acid transport system substrate-binding protein